MLTKNHAILTQEVAAHIEADAVIAGYYWETGSNAVGGTGCFIGCLSHGCDAQDVTDRFGLPLPLVKIAENIFESLPEKDGRDFFAAIPAAVGSDGKDLSLVHWKFLAAELRALPAMPSHIQDVIDPVILGIELLASGGDWPKDAAADAADAAANAAAYAAARAAADAASAAASAAAASAAAYAAYAASAAAYAAASAAAYAAARIRQRDTFLALISGAEVAR